MSIRYRNLVPIRAGSSFLLFIVMALSLTTNFLLLSSSSHHSCKGGICEASLNQDGVRKVMEYIERDGNLDRFVRDALVQQIWRYMNNTNSTDFNANKIGALVKQHPILSQNGTNSTSLTKDEKIRKFLALPIINPHEYSYIFNQSTACSGANLRIIIAVPSPPVHFNKRMKVRESRAGHFVQDPQNSAKLLFFLGALPGNSDSDSATQSRVVEEQKKYGDMVQSSFVDSYRNMSKKAALILRWSSTFCDKSVFVLRMDDDLRADLSSMSRAMEKTKLENPGLRFILGHIMINYGPHRNKASRWYTTEEEYPYEKYPNFLVGGTIGYSVATADLLFKASQRLPPFWLEDVFITGMCASKVGVTIHDSTAFRFVHRIW